MAIDMNSVRDNELLRSLTPRELELIAPACRELPETTDSVLFNEDDAATQLYLIISGQVLLKKRLPTHAAVQASDTVIAACGPSDFVGWSALVAPHIYTLMARVPQRCAAVGVDAQALTELLASHPEVGVKVMTALSVVVSRRLRQITETLIAERMFVMAGVR